MHVRFGQETLYLEGWCARTQYNACCRLLGPGINIHLAENQLLREIFHLGNKVLPPPITIKTSKLERVSIRESDRSVLAKIKLLSTSFSTCRH